MPNGHKVDIKKLDKMATSLSEALADLSNADDFRKLILEWRRPGWTTPAEFIFVSGILRSMGTHAAALAQLKGDLMKGSRAVTSM